MNMNLYVWRKQYYNVKQGTLLHTHQQPRNIRICSSGEFLPTNQWLLCLKACIRYVRVNPHEIQQFWSEKKLI